MVVDGLDPGGEQGVQLQQRSRLGEPLLSEVFNAAVGDLDEELVAHGAEEPFDLPPALRAVRGGVDQADAELAAGPQQPRIDERAAVVDIDRLRDTTGGQRGLQRCGQAHGVLGEPEPVTDQPAGTGRPGTRTGTSCGHPPAARATHRRPTARSASRPRTGRTPHDPGVPDRWPHQLVTVEQAQQRRLRRRPPGRGPQDPRDLRGGAARVLPLQRHRQLQHRRVDAGARLARRGGQRFEPAGR